ncbi:unnamed protein product [Sympodiomycopsis kandeliae]
MASPGTPIPLDEPLSPELTALIYTWADDADRSVVIRNRSLSQIKVLGSGLISAGIPIFVHRRRPCLYATIAGIVVGMTPKDRKWEYLVDDGTQVIDVVVHNRTIPKSIAPHNEPTNQKQQQTASSSRVTLDTFDWSLEPDLHVGDVVKVTGKIWRRQYTSLEERTSVKVGIDVHQVEFLNEDPTKEALHSLQANELEVGEYNRPFGISEAPDSNTSWYRMRSDEAMKAMRHLRALADWESVKQQRAARQNGDPYIDYAEDHQPKCVGILGNEEAGSREKDHAVLINLYNIAEQTRPTAKKRSRESQSSAHAKVSQDDAEADTERTAAPSVASVGPPKPRHRHLRAVSRLSDSECTQSLFRLHVQKILTDYFGGNSSTGSSAMKQCTPPSFTLELLQRVQPLAQLSDRVVSIMLDNRAKKASRKGDKNVSKLLSTEPKEDKIARLFEWCVRQLLIDGFIVIADEQREQVGPPQVVDRSLRKILIKNDQEQQTHRDHEAYQLVTPHLLVDSVKSILNRGPEYFAKSDIILQHLKRTDERWKHVTIESVEDTLVHLDRVGQNR